jgi:hypothetical protein
MLALLLLAAIAAADPAHADAPDASPPAPAAARATARRWLRALAAGDLSAVVQQTTLPFTIATHGFLRRSDDPAGRARTPAELRALLARLQGSLVAGELTTYLQAPARTLSIVVTPHAKLTRVSFVYRQNWLADGTYVDADIDVVRDAMGRDVVSRAKFVAFSLD